MRPIDADVLLKDLCNSCDGWCENMECDCLNCKRDHRCRTVCEIADAPTLDPEDLRPKGRWIKASTYRDEDGYICYEYACSLCNELEDDTRPYCHNCGAKMEEK